MAVTSVAGRVSSSLYCFFSSSLATSTSSSRTALICRRCLNGRRMSSPQSVNSLVVGLGNLDMPSTRHSVGMKVVDGLARRLGVRWQYSGRCLGYVAISEVNNGKVVLLKPKMAMNLNGRSIVRAVGMFQTPFSNIYLVHDDLDKCLGKYTIKNKGSAGGHGGVKSAVGCLKTDAIKRLRIGIGRPEDRAHVIDYVLRDFHLSEVPLVEETVDKCTDLLLEQLKEIPLIDDIGTMTNLSSRNDPEMIYPRKMLHTGL